MKLDDPERKNPLRWVLIAGLVIAVVVAGWLIVTTLSNPDDTAHGESPTTDSDDSPSPDFAGDPVFDSFGRVAYIPKNAPHGVALTTTLTTDTSRAKTQKPDGVLLQKVNGDMVLPFSAADGPTGFTPTGVATGFSHTPQGAALAAIHYMCWMQKPYEHPERVKAMAGHGVVDDDEAVRKTAASPRKGLDMDLECTPGVLKVDYDPILTKVRLGYEVTVKADGSLTNFMNVVVLQWRDGDWILKLHAYGKDEPGSYYGPSVKFLESDGWAPWFTS